MKTSAVLFATLAIALMHAGEAVHAQDGFVGVTIRATNNHGKTATLAAGVAQFATVGIDGVLGEIELPPIPPMEIFDARFVAPSSSIKLGEGSFIDYRPWQTTPAVFTLNYRIAFQAGRTYPSMTLHFPTSFPLQIKTIRADAKTIKPGDSLVTQFAQGDINLSIEFNMAPVTIAAKPTQLSFRITSRDSVLPAPKAVVVTPSASGARWQASADVPWITLKPASGVGTQTMQVGIGTMSFASGVTAGKVFLSNSDAGVITTLAVTIDYTTSIGSTQNRNEILQFDLAPNPTPIGSAMNVISFSLRSQSYVRLCVYSLLGGRVATLIDEKREPGMHTARWNLRDEAGRRIPAGAYVVRLETAGVVRSQMLIVY